MNCSNQRCEYARSMMPNLSGRTADRGPIQPRSTLLVPVEDIVLCLHGQMARISAVGMGRGIGSELARRGVVVEHRISPAARLRKSLAVFFHHESLLKNIGHIYI